MKKMEKYLGELGDIIREIDQEKINFLANKIIETRDNNKVVYIIGNGGSAANASHWVCDLNKGTLERHYNQNQKRIKAVSLTDNIPLMTALSNDLGYDEIYSQQLRNWIMEGDLLITITGSGKSKNIINAINVAKMSNAYVMSLVGFDGGEVMHMSDDALIVPSNNYGIIDDVHSIIGHIVTEKIKGKSNFVK